MRYLLPNVHYVREPCIVWVVLMNQMLMYTISTLLADSSLSWPGCDLDTYVPCPSVHALTPHPYSLVEIKPADDCADANRALTKHSLSPCGGLLPNCMLQLTAIDGLRIVSPGRVHCLMCLYDIYYKPALYIELSSASMSL